MAEPPNENCAHLFGILGSGIIRSNPLAFPRAAGGFLPRAPVVVTYEAGRTLAVRQPLSLTRSEPQTLCVRVSRAAAQTKVRVCCREPRRRSLGNGFR